MKILSKNPQETKRLAAQLANIIQAGDIIGLNGELGSGKTCFIEGIIKALKVKNFKGSPSYIIANEYQGEFPIYHLDFYRLNSLKELEEIGIDEYLYGEGVALIEWLDNIPQVEPEQYLEIRFKVLSDQKRELGFIAHGRRGKEILDKLQTIVIWNL